MHTKDMINAVRDYAYQHYGQDGWDYIVECWSDEDILQEIMFCKSAQDAIYAIRRAIKPLADMRDDVRGAGN